jgi:flagellar biosynthesis protein FlhG
MALGFVENNGGAQNKAFGGNGGGTKPCQVWAVAGGKGGTGKSFVTSSLGISLADKGKKVVLIDADLGGANLHSFLGISRPQKTISEFFERKVPLEDLLVESGVPGLSLISGDLHSLDSESVKFTQKLKLYRHIRSLDADFVLIDLGSGSHNNTVDTFIFADRMVAVIVPVKTSIENMYQFVKNVYFRKLKMFFGDSGLRESVMNTWKNRASYGIRNFRELLDYLRITCPSMDGFFDSELDGFKINLVLNQIRSPRDVPIGNSVKSVFKKYLA